MLEGTWGTQLTLPVLSLVVVAGEVLLSLEAAELALETREYAFEGRLPPVLENAIFAPAQIKVVLVALSVALPAGGTLENAFPTRLSDMRVFAPLAGALPQMVIMAGSEGAKFAQTFYDAAHRRLPLVAQPALFSPGANSHQVVFMTLLGLGLLRAEGAVPRSDALVLRSTHVAEFAGIIHHANTKKLVFVARALRLRPWVPELLDWFLSPVKIEIFVTDPAVSCKNAFHLWLAFVHILALVPESTGTQQLKIMALASGAQLRASAIGCALLRKPTPVHLRNSKSMNGLRLKKKLLFFNFFFFYYLNIVFWILPLLTNLLTYI